MRSLVPASPLALGLLTTVPLACGDDGQREDTDGQTTVVTTNVTVTTTVDPTVDPTPGRATGR